MYDSTDDTNKHIDEVRKLMRVVVQELEQRAIWHDNSKLHEPEKSTFDRMTPKLKELTYGTAEYKEALEEMGVALTHHYKENAHHPEHHENGVDDMTLIDVIEMTCDWLAASKRHKDGDVYKSIELNRQRFKIDAQLAQIIANTMERVFQSERR